MNEKRKKILIWGGSIFVILVIISAFLVNYFISNKLDNFNFKVTAKNSNNGEIPVNTSFIIESEKNYSKGLIKKVVSINPSFNYSLDKMEKGKYIITPKENLMDDKVYNVCINLDENRPPLSWAFQTIEEFKVESTLPGLGYTYIDNNTGIEVNFSKQLKSAEGCFEIKPNVPGKLKVKDKKLIFVPNELLKDDTVYTIKVKKGVKSLSDEELKEDYSFSFRTKNVKPYLDVINGYHQTLKPNKVQSIGISADEFYKNADFNVNIYKLNSSKEYANYLESHYKNVDESVGATYDYLFDMKNHENVLSFSTKLVETDIWYKNLIFPSQLPVGWYIVDIKNSLNDIHLQKAIQISDVSLYSYGLNGDIKLWINDSATNSSLSGATVQLDDLAAISNKDGIASFNIAKDDKVKIFITTQDKKEYVDYMLVTNIYKPTLSEDYYMYVYTDRKQYLPTDTINYWGVILPRKTNIKIPSEVEVSFCEDIKQKAKVNKDGMFNGSVDIISHNSSYGGISLKVLDRENYMGEISISDYIKPVYKLSSSFSKDYYRKGENIDFSVYGKFYDGTSAENIKVKITENNNEYKTVTLNNNGEANTQINTNSFKQEDGVSTISTALEIEGIDEYASSYNSTMYFATDYYIKDSWDPINKKLTLSTNKVNYSNINGKNVDYTKLYTGESFDQSINAALIEVKNEKRYTGETKYDEYLGEFVPEYTYDRVEKIIEKYNWNVLKDQKLVIDLPKVGENEKATYQVRLKYTYPDGFSGKRNIEAWTGGYYGAGAYYFESENTKLKENETTKVKLQGDSKKEGRIFYIVSTDKVNKIGVTNSDNIEVKMAKDLIPGCMITGAFFDGTTVYEVYKDIIYYNTEDKKLNIDITTDKLSYSPGQKVKAKAKVTDTNGKPVQGNILFSVVDEASLYNGYEEDIMDKIYYARLQFPITFSSDTEKNFGGEGGGGGEDIRDTFTDVLAFKSIYTNKNGEAEIDFKVSDDLTSWRITCISIDKNMNVGKAKKNITTSIPFFINQVLNKKYLNKDDMTFSIRTAGKDSSLSNGEVKYTAELLDMDGNLIKTETKTNKPLDAVMFNFGKLPVGKYQLKSTAELGKHKDILLKEFEVVDSLHEISITKEIDIKNISQITPEKYPVKLMLFDKNNSKYYKALNKILKESNGGTNEQVFARNYAHNKLNEFYGKEIYDINSEISLQDYSGGAVKLRNKGPESLFTAQVVANLKEYVNPESAKNYFHNNLLDVASNPNDVASSYMGLAALKEPVLSDIKYMLDNNTGFEIREKISLINALVYIGDHEGAIKYYEKEIKPIMKSEGDKLYISPDYEGLYYQATSRLIPILALTNHPDFDKVLNYVIENETSEYVPVMDLISFISNYNPTKEGRAEIVYKVNGKKEKVNFSKEKIKILELDKTEYENFVVDNIKGDVSAIVEYIGNDISNKSSKDYKITKTISNGELGEYSDVNINVSFPENRDEWYVLDDIIPTSSRYVGNSKSDRWVIVEKTDGQKVKIYINAKNSNNININYRIRNLLTGEFAIEPLCLTNSYGKILTLTNSNSLTFNVK